MAGRVGGGQGSQALSDAVRNTSYPFVFVCRSIGDLMPRVNPVVFRWPTCLVSGRPRIVGWMRVVWGSVQVSPLKEASLFQLRTFS